MVLRNKYAIGCLVMFYEIEMLEEYVQSIMNMCSDVENPENVTIHFCWNIQEYLEKLDLDKISKFELGEKFFRTIEKLIEANFDVEIDTKDIHDEFYNIAQYRRDINYNYCSSHDFVIWGETDSLFPREGLQIIESIAEMADSRQSYRYIISFADRKNWDASWDVITHPLYEGISYQDDSEWVMNNEASSKSYMTIDRMNEINDMVIDYDIRILHEPKFDGSCLVISSELIKAGVNIPHAITHCAEDTSFGEMAKLIMGSGYTQYLVKNILRVHNRRHPKKRLYIYGEDNARGLAGMSKGEWWDILEKTSKYNLSILRNHSKKFISLQEVLKSINNVKKVTRDV